MSSKREAMKVPSSFLAEEPRVRTTREKERKVTLQGLSKLGAPTAAWV